MSCQATSSFRLRHLLAAALFALAGCAGDAPPAESFADAGRRAETADAMDGADLDPACDTVFYADADGDGFGDPNYTAVDCTAPEGFISDNTDCDDGDRYSHPGASEVCDGIDNDCSAETVETCANNCAPHTDPSTGKRYLFCNAILAHSTAQAACAADQMNLARVDSLEEHSWLANQRQVAFGGRPETWIGASDSGAEGVWLWPDGSQFWQGGSNGAPVNSLYSNWRGGEPNNGDGGTEHCAVMDDSGDSAAGQWDDKRCTDGRRFICERE